MELSEKLSSPLKNGPFYCRPMCFVSSVFLVSMFLVQTSLVLFTVFVILTVFAAVYIAFTDKSSKRFRSPLPYIMLVSLLLGSVLPLPSELNYKKLSGLSGEATVKAVITEAHYEEIFGSSYRVKLEEIDGIKCTGYADAEFYGEYYFSEYDTVTFTAELSDGRQGLGKSELLNAKSKNICLVLEAENVISVTDEAKSGLLYLIDSVRGKISGYLDSLLSSGTSAYAKALITGDTSGLSGSFRSDMSALGVSHILAVSGMHMSIISLLISSAMDRFRSSRKLKSIGIISGALIFMAVAGFSPSVTRAGIMLIISMLSVFSGAKSDSLTSLMLSGVIICAVNPGTALSCSFLLSFFATLGIILCALYAERSAGRELFSSRAGDLRLPYKILRKLLFSFLVTLCATLFTVPVMSLYFSEVSFFSLFINPVAIPAAFVSMLLAVLTMVFGRVPVLGKIIISVFEFLYSAFEDFVGFVSDNFSTSVSLRYPFFVPCVILLISALVFLYLKGVKNPLAVISAFTVCAVIFASSVQIYNVYTAGRSEAVYIADKNSEGFIVNSGSKTMYIDIGNGSKKLPLLGIEEAENNYYETSLDALMITHYHSNHIGSVKRLLQQNSIDTLYLPYPETENEHRFYGNIIKAAESCGIVMYKRGEGVKFGDALIETAGYCLLERSAHPVIIIRIAFGNKGITYLGASVSESPGYPAAEKFVSESGAVICGRHGPTVKENDKFLCTEPGTDIYVSPYSETDAVMSFPGTDFIYLKENEDGYVKAVFGFEYSD